MIDNEIPITPAYASQSYSYQGCGHYFKGDESAPTTIVDGYCGTCVHLAQDLQDLAVKLLPSARYEAQDGGGSGTLESVVDRAIYAAQMMQAKCLKAVK